eukprot:scaffold6586_cov108-Skeletonema_marinoi.AAC.2
MDVQNLEDILQIVLEDTYILQIQIFAKSHSSVIFLQSEDILQFGRYTRTSCVRIRHDEASCDK